MRLLAFIITIGLAFSSTLYSNPTGLIDDLALGINRNENPEELIVEREDLSDNPYLALSQSGNLIFQINANGNIEWAGVLNTNKTTFTGNLAPEKQGFILGAPNHPWTRLYLKDFYLPLSTDEKSELTTDTVNSTIEQLVAVTSGNNNSEISLQLKTSKVQSITQPIQQRYFNASHLIPILVKRLQDDGRKTIKLEEKLKSLSEENLKNNQLLNNVREINEKLEGQLKESLKKYSSESNLVKQEIDLLKKELKNIKGKLLTTEQPELTLKEPLIEANK